MAEFAYNNAKNASTGHTPFKLNYDYYFRMFFKKNIDSRSRSNSPNEISAELKELMIICRKNLYYAQKFQKRVYNKDVKSKNYAPDYKVWLNSKYIKIKWNKKLKAKFFKPFWVLYPVSKQVYKLELPRK